MVSSCSLEKGRLLDLSLAKLNEQHYLNAFTFVNAKKHNYVDRSVPQNKCAQPLHGVPIAIKDNFCVKDMFATCASKMLHNFMAVYTATPVQKLINAGAIILGKTNMDEFGMGNGTVDTIFGPTKNVWNLAKFMENDKSFQDWYIPGGSSGGSAVAVASGICMGALGSDTGGSVRNPASYCGVIGLKPTYGTVSRHGLIPLVNSMDVPGILCRSVDDCAMLYDVIKGRDENDSTTVDVPDIPTLPTEEGFVKGIKIGLAKEYREGVSSEILETMDSLVSTLGNEGAEMHEVSLPHTKYSIVCYSILNSSEVASNMARYDGLRYGLRTRDKRFTHSMEALYARSRHEGFNEVVRGRILAGNYFLLKENYEKYFVKAMKVRRLIVEDFEKVWSSGMNLLLTPVTLTTAPKYSDFIKWDNRTQSSVQDYCTQSANMAGLPALSIPIKLNAEGLPVSLQLMGPRFSEKLLFEVAKRIENVVNFNHNYALKTFS